MDTHCHFREAVLEGLGRVFFLYLFFSFNEFCACTDYVLRCSFRHAYEGVFFFLFCPSNG